MEPHELPTPSKDDFESTRWIEPEEPWDDPGPIPHDPRTPPSPPAVPDDGDGADEL